MTEFVIGMIGVAVGAVIQFALDRAGRWLDNKRQREVDEKRKKLLKTKLENPPPGQEWIKLQTLSRIIGADYDTTTRLLIEIGARGSELENEVWALQSDKPLDHTRT